VLGYHEHTLWKDYLLTASDVLTNLPDYVDLLAVEIPVSPAALPDGILAEGTHTVLAGMMYYCNGNTISLYKDIETSAWEYTLGRKEFFPLVLSPVYPSNHPRHVAWRQPVALLQPESSFTRHGISSSAPSRPTISALVESAFLRAGKQYFGFVTRNLPKALRVIKPLLETSSPVQWWRTRLLVELGNVLSDNTYI
jgi:hypothetical protein